MVSAPPAKPRQLLAHRRLNVAIRLVMTLAAQNCFPYRLLPGFAASPPEDSLTQDDPPLAVLFKEDEGGLFGSAYHADLLWALETLAWSRDYLPKVTDLLATLATIDPGGSWSNRPARSLRQIYLLWLPPVER